MKRRAYLSLVAVALAGCGGDGGESTATDTDMQTATQTPTATPTPTDAPTPTPEPAPEDPIEAFEWHMANGLEAFTAEGYSFGGMYAGIATTHDEARAHLDEADAVRTELSESSLSGDRQSRFEDLTGTYNFLDHTIKAHRHLRESWVAAVDTFRAITSGEGSPNAHRQTMTEGADRARSDLNLLQESSDASDLGSFSRLLPSDYDAKVSQIDSDITHLKDLAEDYGILNSGMQEAARGFQFYESESYNSAVVAFSSAKDSFDEANRELQGSYPNRFRALVNIGLCLSYAMGNGCQRMAEVSSSASDGNVSDPEAAKEQARSRFAECDIVFDEVTIVQEFYGE